MAIQVSLCLIVKNEEKNLPVCLASTCELVDEIVIADTGSTDRTRQIGADFRARVFDLEWDQSFSAARNECVRRARGRWILYLDADEYVDPGNREKLRALLKAPGTDNAAYVFQVRSKLVRNCGAEVVVADQVRLFRNHAAHRWQYRIHEQIVPALHTTGASIHGSGITIDHSGYEDRDWNRVKLERNLKLLYLDHKERPRDPYVLFYLGWTMLDLGRAGEALPFLRGSQERFEGSEDYLSLLHALEIHCLKELGQIEEAAAVCQAGRRRCPEDAGLLFQDALLRNLQGDSGGAEACLRRLLQLRPRIQGQGQALAQGVEPRSRFPCMFEGLHGYLTRFHLGLVLSDQGRLAEAEAEWRAVLEEQPGFVAAEIELARLLLHQGREGEAEKALGHVLAEDPDQVDCWCNLAKLLKNQNRLAEAVEICRQGRKYFPDEPDLVRIGGMR